MIQYPGGTWDTTAAKVGNNSSRGQEGVVTVANWLYCTFCASKQPIIRYICIYMYTRVRIDYQ